MGISLRINSVECHVEKRKERTREGERQKGHVRQESVKECESKKARHASVSVVPAFSALHRYYSLKRHEYSL